MVLAVIIHNITEGLAIGVAFGSLNMGIDGTSLVSAIMLSVGIGLQNFPEGAAISLPIRQSGMGRGKAFLYGMASGFVEPVFGIITVLIAGTVVPLMPWLLAFAAGAMLYVVVEELIPQSQDGEHSNIPTIAFAIGFAPMMILDVALG